MVIPASADRLSPVDRRALQSIAAQFFVNGALFASFIPRLPEIRDEVGVSVRVLGALLAIGAMAGVVGSALVGPLIARFTTRHVLIGGASALCIALPLIGFATAPAVLLVGLAAMSVFDVLVDSAMNLQGSWISGRRSAPVMNRLHGLWSLGTVTGGFAASRLAAAGVPLRWHLVGVAALLASVLVFVGRGLLRTDERHVHDAAHDVTATATPVRARMLNRVRGPLMVFAFVGACSIAMETTSTDWAAFRLSDDFGSGPGVAGLAYVAFTVGMTSGRLGGDSMIVRFGHQRVADAGIAIALVALGVASFVPSRWVVVAAYLVAGLGVATQFPKLYDDAARYPGRTGAGLGALTGGSRVALLLAPVFVGFLASTSLSIGSATAIVTLPAALGFFVATRPSRMMRSSGSGVSPRSG